MSALGSSIVFYERPLMGVAREELRGSRAGAVLCRRYLQRLFPFLRRHHRHRHAERRQDADDRPLHLTKREDAGDALTGHRVHIFDKRLSDFVVTEPRGETMRIEVAPGLAAAHQLVNRHVEQTATFDSSRIDQVDCPAQPRVNWGARRRSFAGSRRGSPRSVQQQQSSGS